MSSLTFSVQGVPAPQGSKTRTRFGGMREANENTQLWRDAVAWGARAAFRPKGERFVGPVALIVDFRFPRLKSHYRANGELKQNAPRFKVSVPDIDKLARAVCDALTAAGVWRDDAVVARLECVKTYADEPGAQISIIDMWEAAA